MKSIFFMLKDLDTVLGKLFFKVHSPFSRCFKDFVFSTLYLLKSSNFKEVGGYVSIVSDYSVKDEKKKKRGAGGYSFSMKYDRPPKEFIEIISKHRSEIEAFLGKNFLYEDVIFWRNTRMPEWAESYDLYSNVWHMDSHDGNRFLKIFINLSDVKGEEDGAFIMLNRDSSVKHFYNLYDRWTFDMQREVKPTYFDDQILFTSKPGGYMIVNVGNCFHRASNPTDYRDILQISLYPSWRKIPERKLYTDFIQ